MKYTISVKETNYGTIEVDADSPEETIKKQKPPTLWAIPFGGLVSMSCPMQSELKSVHGTETPANIM